MNYKNTKLLSLLLALLLTCSLFLGFQTVLAEEKTQDIIFRWHHEGSDKGDYNSVLDGTPISFEYCLRFDGTDAEGNPKTSLRTESKTYTGTIGNDTTIPVVVSEMRDYDGNIYTDCSIYNVDILYDPSSIVLMSGKAGNDPVVAQMCQNMKIYTTCVLADGSIVLEQDKSDLNVNYCIASKGNSETDFTQPYKGSSRFPIEYEALFEPGFLDLFASRSFRRAITGNSLSMFTYVSGRTTTFKLVAEFTGERKADLDKRYNLGVTGDDESGWTVTLTSNIKEGADVERTEIPYGIVYQIDPSLAAGEKKLLQAGKNGYHEKRTAYYYLEGDNGEKEILEYLDPVETTVEAQPEIYLTGPADEDVPNQETVRLTFDPADGVWADGSNQPKIIYAAVGDIVTIPAGPEKKDQEFLYWQGSKYYPGQAYEVTEDHIFVAKYSDDDDDANEAVIVAWGASDNSDNSNNINQAGLPATNQQLVQQLPQTGEASVLTQPATLISFAALALALVLRKQLGK